MDRRNILTLAALTLALIGSSASCTLKKCAVNPPNPTVTPTITGTFTSTSTFTSTFTMTNTSTPTSTFTPTATSTCVSYVDNYGSNTVGNYDFYNEAWTPSTAAGLAWSVTGGELQEAPSGSTTYSYVIANNATYPQGLGDYTVEGDFDLGSGGQGVFGVVFRATAASAHGYIFQWNGLNNRWEIEKQIGVGTYYYPGTNSANPYILGTWVHLKATASGNNFNCWATTETGDGLMDGTTTQTFTNVSDPGTTTPYTTGAAGIRTYNIVSGNTAQLDNFTSKTITCP